MTVSAELAKLASSGEGWNTEPESKMHVFVALRPPKLLHVLHELKALSSPNRNSGAAATTTKETLLLELVTV